MKGKKIAAALAGATISAAAMGQDGARTVWYVSPDGTGSACSESQPCALDTAREQVRRAAPSMKGGLAIRLLAGTYRIASPIKFTEADSGRNGHDVVVEAAPGAKVTISGGREIAGWVLEDEDHNIWRADVGKLETRQLFRDGVRARRAVLRPGIPGKTVRGETGLSTDSADPRNWISPSDVEFVWNGHDAGIFAWSEARCRVASVVADGNGSRIDMVQPCFGNAVSLYGAKIVGGGHDLTTPSWAENSLSFLWQDDQAGRWVLQRSAESNRIYYRARAGERPEEARFVASISEGLIHLHGANEPVRNIVLRGIEFSESTWFGPDGPNGFPVIFATHYSLNGKSERKDGTNSPSAVELVNAQDIRLENNAFRRLGTNGIGIIGPVGGVTVRGNVIEDVSGAGILVARGVDRPGYVDGLTIADNVIDVVGVEYGSSPAMFLDVPKNMTIRNNYIANTAYSGIVIGGTWEGTGETQSNRVLNNMVEGVLQRTVDGGGIYDVYIQGTAPDKGLLVEGNVVRNPRVVIPAPKPWGFIGMGLYTDMASTHVTVRGNVSYGFTAATGGANTPYIENVLNTGNFLDTEPMWPIQNGELRNVVVRDNITFDRATAAAQCAADATCSAIVAGAGLSPAYQHLMARRYAFAEWPFADGSAATTHDFRDVHSGIDFGRDRWVFETGLDGYASHGFIRFKDGGTDRSLSLPAGLLLEAIRLEGTGRYRIDDGVNPPVDGALPGIGKPTEIRTGWTKSGRTVTLEFSAGAAVAVDAIVTAQPD